MKTNDRDHLGDALLELDATPTEIAAWTSLVQRLAEWPEKHITPADQRHLLSVLTHAMPQHSVVRQTIRERQAHRNRLVTLLATAHMQVSVLRLTFWLLSLAIILVGVVLELSTQQTVASVWLRALAPLLAYLSVASTFRGIGLQTLESELACPPSALQLIVARLMVVLSYDVGLGLLLSLVGWAHGSGSFLAVTLYWLVPLLLVAGLALVLLVRLPVLVAVTLAYSSWLALLLLNSSYLPLLFTFTSELLLSLVGLSLIAIALWRFAVQMPPHFFSAAP